MSEQPVKTGDFVQLRRSGARPGAGLLLGTAVVRFCDAAARGLAAIGVGPNAVTWTGLAVAGAAAVCFLFGAGHVAPWEAGGTAAWSWWPVMGAVLLLLSAALDMLDGALARAGDCQSDYGALLDSSLDRVAETLVYLGCAAHFALAGNATFAALSLLAVGGSFLVSYTKARAENFGVRGSVGYWQRGERLVLFVVAAAAGHVPAALWLLAVGPWFTVVRRLRSARAALQGGTNGPAVRRWPRGSLGYDLGTAVLVAYLIAAPWLHPVFTAAADPLRSVAPGGS
ncbi:MAG: CDP-alcohol phosphatidyltransferase family protein [Planctomycetota bacterium]|jgi:CDP-diacylglycerol--glycerol-3-phosphate 3-phosphatidyltransferase